MKRTFRPIGLSVAGFLPTAAVVVFLVLSIGPAALAQAPSRAAASSPRNAQKLLAEGDRLAKKKDYPGALLRYKDAYEQIVPKLRGLEFKRSVKAKLMTRDELKIHMAKLLREEFSAAEMHLLDRTLKVFALAPMKLDVEQTLINLYTEEVAGFYNPANKNLVLIKEADKPKKRGLLELLLGSSPAFDTEEQRTTLAHEMTHALADQHFDLHALHLATRSDDDMALALSALIEGEATLLMFAEMSRDDGDARAEDAQAALHMSPRYIDFAFVALKAFLPFAGGKTFSSAPLILRESLLFPYHKGTVFLLHATNGGDWKPVNAAFRDPPTSTEQILHPEKYFGKQRDVPTEVALPKLGDAVDPSWKELGGNVQGEFQIAVILAGVAGANQAAAGWDGDRYVVFENDKDRLALVWQTTWDSPEDARQFAAAYAKHLRKTLKLKSKPSDKDQPEPAFQAVVQIENAGQLHHVECRERDVAVIQGFSSDETRRLIPLAFAARKTPKVFKLIKASDKDAPASGNDR